MRKKIDLENLPDASYELLNMINEKDAVCVLIGAAFVDNLITSLLLQKLGGSKVAEDLLSTNGALGPYASRAALSYCLKIIEKNRYDDILTIGKIRNRFAHSFFGLSFNEPDIQSLCNCLKEWRNIIGDEIYRDPSNLTSEELCERVKIKFINSVTYLSIGIMKDAGLKFNPPEAN